MLTGPPGVGKTLLAQRLPGLLPRLADEESLEVTAIHSVAGLLSPATPLITRPPFVAPHHAFSVAALGAAAHRGGAEPAHDDLAAGDPAQVGAWGVGVVVMAAPIGVGATLT
jgi:predicted ATPase with chaperone activity